MESGLLKPVLRDGPPIVFNITKEWKITLIYLVCINKSQSGAIVPMLAASKAFDDRRILVLDRSPEICPYGWPHVVRNSDGDGFQAGRMRDIGLTYVRSNFADCSGILFIDGDRIPQEDLLPFCVGDCTLFSVVDDMRGEVPDRLCDCTEWCKDFKNSPFMSPALYLSMDCINAVLEDGRLFASCFDGIWGEEDRDLGDRIVNSGFCIMATNAKVSGSLVDRFARDGIDKRNFLIRKKRHESRLNFSK